MIYELKSKAELNALTVKQLKAIKDLLFDQIHLIDATIKLKEIKDPYE